MPLIPGERFVDLRDIQHLLSTKALLSRTPMIGWRAIGCSSRNAGLAGEQSVALHGTRDRLESNRLVSREFGIGWGAIGCCSSEFRLRGKQWVALRGNPRTTVRQPPVALSARTWRHVMCFNLVHDLQHITAWSEVGSHG